MKKIEMRIVFDTNAIYHKVAHDLLSPLTAEFIKTESVRSDINIKWYIPEVVMMERQYQMQKAADLLLPSLEKMETLLGHKMNITSEIFKKKVIDGVDSQIKEFQLNVLEIDHSKINLKKIIENSCFREPPFSKEKEEKGFRDAMIAEAFFQLVSTSSKSTRLIFFTGDVELKSHIEETLKSNKNVDVLGTIEEVKGLINTLTSDLNEDTIKRYQQQAAKIFFEKGNTTTQYYKKKIGAEIAAKYAKELNACPPGKNGARASKGALISMPQFIKKERTFLSWVSRIEVQSEIKLVSIYPDLRIPSANSFTVENMLSSSRIPYPSTVSGLIYDSVLPEVIKCRSIFDVRWKVSLGKNNKLTRFVLEDIKYIETIWDEKV